MVYHANNFTGVENMNVIIYRWTEDHCLQRLTINHNLNCVSWVHILEEHDENRRLTFFQHDPDPLRVLLTNTDGIPTWDRSFKAGYLTFRIFEHDDNQWMLTVVYKSNQWLSVYDGTLLGMVEYIQDLN